MRLINYITKCLSQRRTIQHPQQRRCFYTENFHKFRRNKNSPQCQVPFRGHHSEFRGHQTPQYSIFYSFIRKSYCSSSSSTSSSKNQKMGFLSWYLSVLDSRPILTKKHILFSYLCSCRHNCPDDYNATVRFSGLSRTSRMAAYGLFILGVAQHMWFNFVARVLPRRDVLTTLKKLVMGQLLFGPAVTSMFFSFNAALLGESTDEIAARLKRDLLPTLLNGLMFWPLCDFLTYKIIPVHLQPLMNSSFSYLWTIYLTYMASLQKAAAV